MTLNLAWIAQGRIRTKSGDEAPRTVESQFGQSIRERAVKAQQRHAWKTGGDGEKFLAGAMLWGRVPKDPAAVRITITSLCRGTGPNQLLYSLETEDLCSILQLDHLGSEERRLWNKNDKRLDHLAMSERGELACSARHEFGTANIAVRLSEETGFSEVTEGDSFDTAPRWIPGDGRRIVFQSAGVGRDRNGHFARLGPFSIQRLDIDSGEMHTLLENPRSDYLNPQVASDGAVYCIRRPHLTGREIRPLHLIRDVLLFPFRLGYALFHYLQFFSMRYTGRKLTTSGGAQGREMDVKQMLIWGNVVSAEHAGRQQGEAPDLVPKSWELIRQKPGSGEESLARGVLAFDMARDGSIVYSNGSALFVRDPAGEITRLLVENLIERVVVLDSGPNQPATRPGAEDRTPKNERE